MAMHTSNPCVPMFPGSNKHRYTLQAKIVCNTKFKYLNFSFLRVFHNLYFKITIIINFRIFDNSNRSTEITSMQHQILRTNCTKLILAAIFILTIYSLRTVTTDLLCNRALHTTNMVVEITHKLTVVHKILLSWCTLIFSNISSTIYWKVSSPRYLDPYGEI